MRHRTAIPVVVRGSKWFVRDVFRGPPLALLSKVSQWAIKQKKQLVNFSFDQRERSGRSGSFIEWRRIVQWSISVAQKLMDTSLSRGGTSEPRGPKLSFRVNQSWNVVRPRSSLPGPDYRYSLCRGLCHEQPTIEVAPRQGSIRRYSDSGYPCGI